MDFGTGKSRLTSVSEICTSSSAAKKTTSLLQRVSAWQQPASILELGTSLGLSTAAFALSCPQAKIFSIEACHEVADIARRNMQNLSIKNVEILTSEIGMVVDSFTDLSQPVLVYFDANHACKPTMEYFNSLLPLADENCIFIFDDIHWSADMEIAWKQICAHPQTTICLDLFQTGIVFFNSAFSKQIFKIRY